MQIDTTKGGLVYFFNLTLSGLIGKNAEAEEKGECEKKLFHRSRVIGE